MQILLGFCEWRAAVREMSNCPYNVIVHCATCPSYLQLAALDHLIVIASGADRVAGRELTLKIEEAAWIPTAYRDLETFLHGHLPATDERTGLVLVLTEG